MSTCTRGRHGRPNKHRQCAEENASYENAVGWPPLNDDKRRERKHHEDEVGTSQIRRSHSEI